jgi:glycerate kinase
MTIYKVKPLVIEFDDDPIESTPKVLCIGHGVEGFLDVRMACKSLELGARIGGGEVMGSFCISDGGRGFLEAFRSMRPVQSQRVVTVNPFGRIHMVEYLYDHSEQAAAVEVEHILGLGTTKPEERNVMTSSSEGLADVLLNARTLGVKRLYLGLGATCAWDGGRGMLVRLLDVLEHKRTDRTHYGAQELTGAGPVQLAALREAFHEIEIHICASSELPLLGKKGAVQEATGRGEFNQQENRFLEGALHHWVVVLEEELQEPLSHLPGAGAAGGLGMALAALGGQITTGPRFIFEMAGLEKRLQDCDGLITCDRSLTQDSFQRSAAWKACRLARKLERNALLACVDAEPAALAKAREYGVTIAQFGGPMRDQSRNVEAFALLQQVISRHIHMLA